MTSYILLPLAPGDYTAIVNRRVTFEPGDTQQTVLFSTASDGVLEDDERFTGQLTTTDRQVSIFQDTADVDIKDTTPGGI